MNKKFRSILLSNLLLSQTFFFSLFAILGLKYQGSEESNLYAYYLITSSFFVYVIFFLEITSKKIIKPSVLYLFGFSIILILFKIIAPTHGFVTNQTNLFFVLVLPSAFVGYLAACSGQLPFINKSFVFLSIVVFIAVLRILPKLYSSSVIDLMDIFGGGQYQAFSYYCAFSYLTIFHQLIKKSYSNRKILLLLVVILLVLFTGVFLSGGRGGLLVVLLGTIILTIREKGFLRLIKYFLFISCFLYALYVTSYNLNFFFSDRIVESFDRIFSFISLEGIDMDGTSNRDYFYSLAISMIKRNIFFGYGFFGLVGSLGDYYPHNIFLELLLQGGLFFLIFFIFLGISFVYKLRRLIRLKKDEDFILIPIIYCSVLLMFSSSYLIEPLFWFSLTYVFSFPHYLLKK